jgi:nucleoside phosphorylase
MSFRTARDVRAEFLAHPRRALVITTVKCESLAIKAHLAGHEILIGEKDAFYEYGRFSDPAGEWLVVHAITPQGNSDTGLVVSKAHQDFGSFNVQMFVGIAGSLKDDIAIGGVVVGDYVYNGHSAKVEDAATLGRPHGLRADRALLVAAQALIYSDEWRGFIRPPFGMTLPSIQDYPCESPPSAVIKGIVSGEEVVAGGKSQRFIWLRSHFNDCGAVEMEGWGAMNAAYYENAPAIVVRGISDMCAGKEHAKDKLHQPIAAAHAAAFAFSILSFRSRVPAPSSSVTDSENTQAVQAKPPEITPLQKDRRIEFVFNFEGSRDDWSNDKIQAVAERLRLAISDEDLTLIRVDSGSVRLVMDVREADVANIELVKLREATAACDVILLGALLPEMVRKGEQAGIALAAASRDLLAWEKTLPNGKWMERPESEIIEARFRRGTSSTVLLGEPGSGKSALLSKIASDLLVQGAAVFALKSDFLSPEVRTEIDLQAELQLPSLPSDLILSLASLRPVYLLIDQLDALASQLDLQSGRLNVLLNLVRRVGGVSNVHILLSARTFEFNHDVRLRAIESEAITLNLPPWHEVKERLSEVGVESETWPERARAVVRIPQALKTYIAIAGTGRTEPYATYQAMLEQLWRDRIASDDDSESLIALASDLASEMAEKEVLWLAASRFDDRWRSLQRLEALGFTVRSESGLSVAFSHQTIFEYVLARTFVRNALLLSTYVLERQNSLFVRAKVWAGLSYLRGAEPSSYEREFLTLWETEALRRHLRLLLIEFLGQISEPLEFEKRCMASVLQASEIRVFGLKAIANNPVWFPHFAGTAIRDSMSSNDAEAFQALRILISNWKTSGERVARLIKENWLPHAEKDRYSWAALADCHTWSQEIEQMANELIGRGSVSTWQVDHAAQMIAVEQPEVAVRFVRSKLDFLLAEVEAKQEFVFSEDAAGNEERLSDAAYRRGRELEKLLHSTEWHDLPSLAEAAPATYLKHIWPWYQTVFLGVVAHPGRKSASHIYPGQYVLELKFTPSSRTSASRSVLISALQVAVEELAVRMPQEFLDWSHENSHIELLVIQQLIARGYEVGAAKLASGALEWLLADQRRFQLGTSYGYRQTTIDLIRACSLFWIEEEVALLERAILEYRPSIPEHAQEPEQRKLFADIVRATKKDLLQSIGIARLTQESRELVATEQRALGDRFDRSIGEVEGGWIGSPMEAAAMAKAKDRDILKIFRELPDNTNWDHPTRWMRGGNVQLSRAFAEFARNDPERAVRLIEQFESLNHERAAGYALDAMADGVENDSRVVEALLDLSARGFRSDEFRDSVSHAIEKVANRGALVGDDVIDLLVSWLSIEQTVPAQGEPVEDLELKSDSKDEDASESILWGYGGMTILPGGNFNVLSALASILLNRKEPGRDRFLAILNGHLGRERNPNVWKALLYRLCNAGGSTPQVVSAFLRKLFNRFPQVLSTREAILLLAYAQRWDEELVFELIRQWPQSGHALLERGYGELVGLCASESGRSMWVQEREKIVAAGTRNMKLGLAHSAVNLWTDERYKPFANATLVALLKEADKSLVAAILDVFRVADDFVFDAYTQELLAALSDVHTDMSEAPSHFIVERLQALLPYGAEVIAKIADKLVSAWSSELADMRTGIAIDAPQLTDLALTLHRLGGLARESGVSIFERMLELDAYGTRETLAEIDGRFGLNQQLVRRRLPRRRNRHGQAQKAA